MTRHQRDQLEKSGHYPKPAAHNMASDMTGTKPPSAAWCYLILAILAAATVIAQIYFTPGAATPK